MGIIVVTYGAKNGIMLRNIPVKKNISCENFLNFPTVSHHTILSKGYLKTVRNIHKRLHDSISSIEVKAEVFQKAIR